MLRALIPGRPRDEEQGQLAHALGIILWTLIAASLLILALPFLLPGYLGRALLVIFAVDALCLPLLVLNRRGYTRLAGATLVVGLWAVVTTLILTAGGTSSLTSTSYLIVVFVAGVLLGTRAGIATSLLCILTTLSLSILEISGHLQARPVADSPMTRWVSLTLLIVIMMSLQHLAARAIKDALLQTRRELEDRTRAEEALKANEELLRQFIKHTPAAIAMFDTEMRYLQASDGWLTDYQLEDRNIIGKRHYEIFPDIPERWREVHARVLTGASERCDEDPNQLADGTIQWLQWEAIPWRKAGGEIGGMILLTQVITERKRAEEALTESETLFRTIFENSGSAMALIDMHGQLVKYNPALQRILGYAEEELGSMPFTEYTHADDRLLDWKRYGELIAGKRDRYEIEKRFITKAGQVIWGNLVVSLVKDPEGLPKYAVGIFQDITERKRAEEDLRRVSERLQLATRAASIGIWDWDVVNDELVWDDAMYRVYGIRKQDFSGAFHAWERSLAPEDFERATVEVQAALRGEREFVLEFRIVWPDGSVHFTKAASQTFRDQEGRPLRMVGVNYDITARKQAEEALRLSEERFARAFRQP
jgi:PAS domain S-box-containing protein